MIFVIDVGNTNMTMGVFQGKKMEATFPDHERRPPEPQMNTDHDHPAAKK